MVVGECLLLYLDLVMLFRIVMVHHVVQRSKLVVVVFVDDLMLDVVGVRGERFGGGVVHDYRCQPRIVVMLVHGVLLVLFFNVAWQDQMQMPRIWILNLLVDDGVRLVKVNCFVHHGESLLMVSNYLMILVFAR